VYIGMAGRVSMSAPSTNCAGYRSENSGMTLQEFKQTLREQFFSLLLDQDAALAAIPKMLPADAAKRAKALEAIRRTVQAAGNLTGERAERLALVEKMFGAAKKDKAPARAAAASKPAKPAKPSAKSGRKA
jgi:hypothetical protein